MFIKRTKLGAIIALSACWGVKKSRELLRTLRRVRTSRCWGVPNQDRETLILSLYYPREVSDIENVVVLYFYSINYVNTDTCTRERERGGGAVPGGATLCLCNGKVMNEAQWSISAVDGGGLPYRPWLSSVMQTHRGSRPVSNNVCVTGRLRSTILIISCYKHQHYRVDTSFDSTYSRHRHGKGSRVAKKTVPDRQLL